MREILASMAAFPPYAAGWMVGMGVRFIRWLCAAVRAGYLDGTGEITWQDQRSLNESK